MASTDQRAALLSLYESGVGEVYGYLLRRCGSPGLAEDLTNDTFLSAAAAVLEGKVAAPSIAWLITIARHKLVDHWRRQATEERTFRVLADATPSIDAVLPDELDDTTALAVLRELSANHRSALTLRHLDGLSVPEVAEAIGRSVHATETLLVRARSAFRRRYLEVIDV